MTVAVANPGLRGGGGAVIQTLRYRGRSQNIFFRPFGPQFGQKIRGGPLSWILN